MLSVILVFLLAGCAQQLPVPGECAESMDKSAGAVASSAPAARRSELNLLGQADTESGQSRRNENVQFNLVDNNAQKELMMRVGITATVVSEFLADRNYFGSAFGEDASTPLHLERSSANGVHGSAYLGHLNSVFSARSFFQVGAVRPARENEYGLALLLPAWRGVRWQVDGTRTAIRGQVNGNVQIPLASERTPLTTDPGVRAFVQRVLDAYPNQTPNRTDIDPRMLNTNSPQVVDSSFLHSRLDQGLSAASRLIADYEFTLQTVDAFQFVQGQNPDTTTRSQKARLTHVTAFGAATVLELSAGFDRSGSLLVPEPNNPGPHVFIGAIANVAGSTMIPVNRAQNDFRHAVRYRRASGRHEWTAGSDVVRRQLNGYDSDNHMPMGTWAFRSNWGRDAITNLRMGRASTYWHGVGLIHRGFRGWDAGAYAGDRWRVSGRVSLNYGLRWRALTRPSEVNGLTELPYASDWNNVGPLAGIAVRLPGRWGVWRSAGAVHYGEIFPATYQQARFNMPHNVKYIVNDPDLLNPMKGVGSGKPRGVLYDYAPDLSTPYIIQYNSAWEFEPARRWTVQLGYVGNRGVKMLTHWYFNRPRWPKDAVPSTGAINDMRPDPNYLDIRRVVNGSRAWFDAARAGVKSAAWRGLTLEAAYWFSKALDQGGDYTNTAYDTDSFRNAPQSEFEAHRDLKSLSRFDQPHALLVRQSYRVPWFASSPKPLRRALSGWDASGVLLLKSGTPFTVTTGSDSPGYGNVDGLSGDRPDLVDPSVLGRTIGNPDTSRTRLPRAAFAYLPLGALAGSLGRDTFRRGGIYNLNAALTRSWAVAREARLEFRAESVNVLNTPQFAEPGPNLSDPNFGAITNTLNEGRNLRFRLSLIM